MMWRLELEENYFHIYDSKKDIAGYLDPDYGNVQPEDEQDRIIERMLKERDTVQGAFLMLPMVKFGVFDVEHLDVSSLQGQIRTADARVAAWRGFLDGRGGIPHWIHVSHTDQDMLAVTIPIRFSRPTPLKESALLEEAAPILDQLHGLRLL